MKTHMPLKILVLVIIVYVACISCKKDDEGQLPVPDPTLSEKIQSALDNAIADYNGKGVSLAVLLPDGEIVKCASGISHANVKVNTDMLFSAGSITKMFTATTIMQYMEEGLLSLDDSLHQWFPAYDNIDSTINLRQLLNHTSGIYEITQNDAFWQLVFSQPDSILEKEELIMEYTLEPHFEKGTGWNYCNTGYIILRMLVEDLSGKSIASEYRSRLIDHSNLENTFTYLNEELPSNTAHGWFHLDGDNVYDEIPPENLKSFYSAAGGGIFCTAEDLALWANKLFIEKSVVSQSSLDQMLTMHSPCNEEMVESYGLGIYEFNPNLFNGHKIIGHGGDPIGYAAGCFYLPDYNVCIGIMDNTEDGNVMWVSNEVVDLIIEYLEK